ncbi:MAG: hypothetical protein ACRKGH_06220 [Dehalogenimonas sp.]
METLSKKWLIGIIIVAVGLLAVGVPVLASSVNSSVGRVSTAYMHNAIALDSTTLARLASILGLAPADLTTQLQTGKTLAVIAGEKNVPTATLVEAIIAPYVDHVALQVKYGYITQAQAQTLLDIARQAAGTILTQNLASTAGSNTWAGFCGSYLNDGVNIGNGWSMMGSGMIVGWGGYDVSQMPVTGSTTITTPSASFPATQPIIGWGMMGGGSWGCR